MRRLTIGLSAALLLAVVVGPERPRAQMAAPMLLKDINLIGQGSFPDQLVNVNGTLFFRASDGVNGSELWKSDGTAAGTVLVKDIWAGSGSSSPQNLTNVNGTLFFRADDGNSGPELWKSDGTPAGTVLVKDISPGSASSTPTNLTNVNGTLFFTASEGFATTGVELWKSDGTMGGTVLVKDILTGGSGSDPSNLTNVNGTLFFAAQEPVNGRELWKSDGTTAGTVLVKDIRAGVNPSFQTAVLPSLTAVNETLFFVANDGVTGIEVWKSDGTAAGTVLVRDIRSGAGGSDPRELVNVNGTLFFSNDDGATGRELWKSDGTVGGTVLVKDIRSGIQGSSPGNLTNVNGVLFMQVGEPGTGVELWKSDGTAAGTVLVKDIRSGSLGSNPNGLTNVNGTLFFQATDGTTGVELWKSDGTATGTGLVKDILSGANSSNPINLTNLNGTVLFQASDGATGNELWRSDGTAAGTALVADHHQGTNSSNPGMVTLSNGTLFFAADDGVTGIELWKSDGTAAGTVLVRDIWSGGSTFPEFLTDLNGTLFFRATDGVTGQELWRSDGTAAGTVLVKDIRPGPSGGTGSLTSAVGMLFLTANDGVIGTELWKSNGTAAGTVLVKDIVGGSGSSSPQELTNVNGTLFFTAEDGVTGRELWKSDGTGAGTVLVKDIRAGAASSAPQNPININGTFFFNADDGVNGRELWKSDGTAAGTVLVKDILSGAGHSAPASFTNVSGMLFFTANNGINGVELWKSDGSTAGTVLVRDILSGPGSSSPVGLKDVNGMLFFAGNDIVTGHELWKSDGTAPGTVRIKDIWSGGSTSNPSNLTNVNGTVFFRANDGVAGVELWRSDGTEAGTVLVGDILPGAGGSNPLGLVPIGDALIFSADDGILGREPWIFNTSAANAAPTADAGVHVTTECTGTAGTTVTLDGSLSSDPDFDALTYEWRNAAGDIVGTTDIVSLTLPPGTHTFTLTVDDGHGETDSAAVTIVVQDTAAPGFVNVPFPITVEQSSPAGAVVAVPLPGPSDLCDAAPSIVSDAPAIFPPGTTTVTFTATDASGNVGTATTTVTVADTIAPAITIDAPLDGAVFDLQQAVTASYVCSDGGSGVASCAGPVASGASLDTSAAGTLTFTVTATDVAANPASVTVSYTVRKGTPTVNWPPPAPITFGTPLGAVQLAATAGVAGSFVYTPAGGTLLEAGNAQTLSATFTADDTANYESVNASVSLDVLRATPTVTVSGGTFTFDGQPHAATGSVTGAGGADLGVPTFTYNGSPDAPVDAGTYAVVASFAGGPNYEAASTNTATIVIEPAAANLALDGLFHVFDAAPKAAVVSTTPGGLTGVSVTYDGSPTPPTNAGSYTVVATLGDANYAAEAVTGTLVIDVATPAVNVSGGTFTFNGEPHGATGSVTGVGGANLGAPTFTYNGSPDVPVNAGTYAVVASFAGTQNYAPSSTNTATIVIDPAAASLALTNLSHVFDTTAKAAGVTTTPDGLAGVTVTYDGSPTPPTNAGSYAVVATLGDANYAAEAVTGTLVIDVATPAVNVSGGTFTFNGEPHGATGSVTGVGGANLGAPTFTYNGAPDVPVNAGMYHVVASFAGNANYAPASTNTAVIEITPAAATLALTNLMHMFDTTPKAAGVTTTPGGLVGVSITYDGSPTPPTNAGSYAVVATLTHQNYTSAAANGTLVIGKATPAAAWSAPAPIIVGTPLGAAQLNATSSVPGTFTYSPVAGTVLDVGPGQTLSATFTPADADNYNSVPVSTSISVLYSTAACQGAAGHAILPPVNADGTSVYKRNSTVPAKFRVCDAAGNSVGTPGVVAGFYLIQVINGTVSTTANETVESTTPDTTFRWDTTGQQWIFNIATKNLSIGRTYVYRIALKDGSAIQFQYGLR